MEGQKTEEVRAVSEIGRYVCLEDKRHVDVFSKMNVITRNNEQH